MGFLAIIRKTVILNFEKPDANDRINLPVMQLPKRKGVIFFSVFGGTKNSPIIQEVIILRILQIGEKEEDYPPKERHSTVDFTTNLPLIVPQRSVG